MPNAGAILTSYTHCCFRMRFSPLGIRMKIVWPASKTDATFSHLLSTVGKCVHAQMHASDSQEVCLRGLELLGGRLPF